MSTGVNGLGVNEAVEAPPVGPPRARRPLPGSFHSLLAGVSACAPRLLFIGIAAVFTMAGWLRPPLTHDIGGVYLSLGISDGGGSVDALLHGPRRIPWDSAGIVLLVLLGCGAALAVWLPRRFPVVCGVVLCVAIGANAAVALNHPALIERLDSERAQRQQIVQVLRSSPAADPLSTASNGRIAPETRTAARDRAWRDLVRPWDYLLYGIWLIAWAALGVWFTTPGPMVRRWSRLAGWTALGLLLGIGLCAGRLRAEYHWVAAQRAELRGELTATRERIRIATAVCPQFTELERTWLLLGKVDYLESRSTPEEIFFRAHQLAAVTGSSRDDARQREHAIERLRRAVSLMDPLLGRDGPHAPIARIATAGMLTDLGVSRYAGRPRFTDAGIDDSDRRRQLVAAREAWRRAAALDPSRVDDRIYLAHVELLLDPMHPERADTRVTLADRLLQADVLNMLADGYFAAGQMNEARRRYAESLDLLNLPQRKNFRAQKGLGGL